jgi:hypothetical protein
MKRHACAKSARAYRDPAQDAPSMGRQAMDSTNLLDMIGVLEEEQRFNEAAALLCSNAAQRKQYAAKVRQGAAAIKAIRHEMARGGKHTRARTQRIENYIDQLIDTQLEIGRTPSFSLGAQPGW